MHRHELSSKFKEMGCRVSRLLLSYIRPLIQKVVSSNGAPIPYEVRGRTGATARLIHKRSSLGPKGLELRPKGLSQSAANAHVVRICHAVLQTGPADQEGIVLQGVAGV
jgi:hypothetical protein